MAKCIYLDCDKKAKVYVYSNHKRLTGYCIRDGRIVAHVLFLDDKHNLLWTKGNKPYMTDSQRKTDYKNKMLNKKLRSE